MFTPLLQQIGFDWFREPASTTAASIDFQFYVILWISIVFFVGIVAVMVAFVARYYARPGHRAEHTPHHSNTLEATWSIIPGLLVVWIFGAGFWGFLSLRTVPENAYEIQVIAKKWNFAFVYPNGHIDANLHVPIDTPVKLVMTSDDVIHSVYIPAFRVKRDCIPGRYTTLWFEATDVARLDDGDEVNLEDEGGYDLFCTEYCGQGHSSMIAKVIVHEAGTFGPWLEEAMVWDENESPVARGEKLYKERGCSQCHSVDGTMGTGPSFKGVYGTDQQVMVDGTMETVSVDENYIRESILYPMAKIRDGYKGVMPSYQGQLKDNEIAALIYFHKSLNGADTPATWAEAGGVPGQTKKEDGAEVGDAEPGDAESGDAAAETDGEATTEAAEPAAA